MSKYLPRAMGLLLLVVFPLITFAAGDYTGSRWALVDAAQVLAAADVITTNACPNCDIAAETGTAKVTIASADGKFHLTHELDTTPAIVAPADYARLLNAESSLREKSSRAFLLQTD